MLFYSFQSRTKSFSGLSPRLANQSPNLLIGSFQHVSRCSWLPLVDVLLYAVPDKPSLSIAELLQVVLVEGIDVLYLCFYISETAHT